LPALRERKGDIPRLIEYMLAKRGIKKDIPYEVMNTLQMYNWPGNIRELENCIEFMLNASVDDFDMNSLPSSLLMTKETIGPLQELIKLGNKEELLAILYSLQKEKLAGSKTGRRSLRQTLLQQGFNLTEHDIRGRLKKLASAQLVSINLGRAGTILSSHGEELLRYVSPPAIHEPWKTDF
jgi:transcriptional regulator with PAS, ATPase and Fis domain